MSGMGVCRYDHDSIVLLYERGLTRREIAAAVGGCSVETVDRAVLRSGIPRRRDGSTRFDYDEIARRYATSDLTVSALAREIGCHRSTVERALAERGIQVERRRMYHRVLDADVVRQLVDEEGLNFTEIAEILGTTARTVGITYNGHDYDGNTCVDCGTSIDAGARRCKPCADVAMVNRDEDGNLWCITCHTWKPEHEFYAATSRPGRGRKNECRACDNQRRAAYRRAHPEKERAAAERAKTRRRIRRELRAVAVQARSEAS